jgi:hypothetical protein
MAIKPPEPSLQFHDEWQQTIRYRVVTYRQEEHLDGGFFISCGCGSLITWKQSSVKLTRQQVEDIPAFVYFFRANF